jgi:nucleoside-diphosphate-sugar epimerase
MTAAPPAILITGASGFLGRRLAEMVLARGERVRLLLRPSSRLHLADERSEIVRCEFHDGAGLAGAMAGVRIVYNCAGLSSDWGRWSAFRAANVDGVANLLEAARRAGTVERFVHVSSTDVYGYPVTPSDETDELRDVGLPYNRSKCLGDALARRFCRETGLAVTVVRPATIFGPRSKDWVVELGELLSAGRVVTIGGGAVQAGLVYVDDVAQAMIALAGNPATVGEAYNVVDPGSLTWRAYFDRVADGLGVARPRFDLPPATAYGIGWLCEGIYGALGRSTRPLFTRHVARVLSRSQRYDSSKLGKAVGDFPAIGVEEGLARTLAWLKAHRQEQSPLSEREGL